MALESVTKFDHVQFPGGTLTVPPATAVLIAFCTSVDEQLAALTVCASAAKGALSRNTSKASCFVNPVIRTVPLKPPIEAHFRVQSAREQNANPLYRRTDLGQVRSKRDRQPQALCRRKTAISREYFANLAYRDIDFGSWRLTSEATFIVDDCSSDLRAEIAT